MQKESILYGIIGLLTGIVLMGFVATYSVNNNNNGMMRMMGMRAGTASQDMMDDDDMSMGGMMEELKNKTGEDFDAIFLTQMIIHHQGAIDMAILAKANAKHDEVKKLSDDILSAQSKEIDIMQSWQTDWGYKITPQSYDIQNMH